VSFTAGTASNGWNAPKTAAWLEEAMNSASRTHFADAPSGMGEGGSIPFMAMLGQRFPRTQFLITGVLGPESNAHGPNEFLHVPTAMKLTACVADVIDRMP
jgi:acetylornithine deacetylase/succinyl-diaminopimelate desuccinylase-like protein